MKIRRLTTSVVLLCAGLALGTVVSAAAAGPVLYVNQAAAGHNDGSSWAHAYQNLQTALSKAQASQQIWVAQGSYYPSADTDREASFRLVPGVAVYGGFKGDETRLAARDWQAHPTVLSGNIGDRTRREDNSKHVVVGADDALLDGVIIEQGYAVVQRAAPPPPADAAGQAPQTHITPEVVLGQRDGVGAGLLNFQAATRVQNSIIRDNQAMKGGGVFNMTSSSTDPSNNRKSPVFINVRIENNVAVARGGGMSNDLGTHPLILNSSFADNRCEAKGGAIYNDFNASPLILNSRFSGNRASAAAAIGSDGTSSPLMVAVEITGNTAQDMGAALYQGSYNANLADGQNAPVLIGSKVHDNNSETHGLVSVFNWGDSWLHAYDSRVDGWAYGEKAVPAQYGWLVETSAQLAKTAAESVDAATLERLKTAIIRPGAALDMKNIASGFGVKATLATDAAIPKRVFRVDAASRTAAPDGQRWQTAYANLQQAIDAAERAGGGQVWVARGTYRPGDKRQASFQMKKKVAIYGGFQGAEKALSQRDWRRHQTVLSGDIGKRGDSADNSYHVIKGSIGAILDGVVVRDGNADGPLRDGFGGGMFNWGHGASAIVRNTVFTHNRARDGGAIFNFADVLAYFDHIEVIDNHAETGGGLSARFGASIRIDDSVFARNGAEYRGGAVVVNYGANAQFKRVQFSANQTEGNGGAVWVDDQASQYGGTQPVFQDCRFTDNRAGFFGGAIHNYNVATTVVRGTQFSGNQAQKGAAIANTLNSQPTLDANQVAADDIHTDTSSTVLSSAE